MKKLSIIAVSILLFASTYGFSANINFVTNATLSDSTQVNLMAEFSLFYESYKNKEYESSLPHGWTVLLTNPKPFLRYHPFVKMAKMLWFMHDSVATDDNQKAQIADTTLFLYSLAEKYVTDQEALSDFYAQEGFVRESWLNPPDVKGAIAAYEKAWELNPNLSDYYLDRLGLLYAKNASDENDYKMKALELYSKLSEKDPSNEIWLKRIEGLAEDIDELVDITKKAWDLDKENTEKAWKYAELCMKAEEYEKAIEPLKFLIEKSPNVINYREKIAIAYTKLEKYPEAIKAYKELIKLDPKNRTYYVNIAIIYKDMNQLSVARSYLQKAMKVDPKWDYPYYILGTMYEQAARDCGFEFEDKLVYLLAVEQYKKAAKLGGEYAQLAKDRVVALKESVPTKEDYFFRKLKSGDKVKIEGKCYGWIKRSVTVP